MKKSKRFLAGIVCVAFAASLTACNQPAETAEVAKDTANETTESGFVYVPTFSDIGSDSEDSWSGSYTMFGDALYYVQTAYDEASAGYAGALYEYSLADASVKELAVGKCTGNQSMNNYAYDEAGNFYGLYSEWIPSETDEYGGSQAYELVKADAAGTELYRQDITEIVNDGDASWVEYFCVDSKGRVYLSANAVVKMFDENGAYKGNIDTGLDWIQDMGPGKDGNVYISYYDYAMGGSDMAISMLDFEGRKLGEKYSNIPNCNGFYPGATKDFILYNSTEVFAYDMATQTYETVFKWLDVDVNGDYVENMSAVSEEKLVAIVRDWNTNETELVTLEKKAAAEVQQKTVITLGTFSTEQALQAYAVDFNKSNEMYRIQIENYYDSMDDSETSYEDAVARLNSDVIAGNGPDILDMNGMNEKLMVSKGVLEDLTPYLEQSTKLKKEDFVDGILEKFSADGVLAAIPRSVQLNTIVGKTSVVGDRFSWTLNEMMEMAEQYPDAQLFNGMDKNTMLYYCMMFNGDAFVDWQEGTTSFDSEEFKAVLSFINMFPDEFDWESYDGSVSLYQEDKVLLESAYISDFQQVQYYEAMFNEPTSFVGFPMAGEGCGTALTAQGGRYAISSKSEYKDAAWEFIEGFLLMENEMFDWGFSTIQAKLDAQMEEETKVDYIYDENGEIMYDENGEPLTYGGGMTSIGSDGWEYTYHTATQEEAELTLKLLSIAQPTANTTDTEINAIIQEEAAAYFNGQKSVDEVAEIIQNRASIYVSENS